MSMCDGRQTQPSRHVNGALRFANERETVVRFQSNTPRAKLLTIEIGVQYSYSAHTNKRVNTEILILSQYVGFIVPRLVRGSTSGASLRQVLRARVSCHSFLVHFPRILCRNLLPCAVVFTGLCSFYRPCTCSYVFVSLLQLHARVFETHKAATPLLLPPPHTA